MSTTVPALSIVCMAASGLIALLLPVILFLIARRRYKAHIVPLLLGAAVFVLFALFLRPFFDAFIGSRSWFVNFVAPRWWASGLYMSFAAGLFEETGRLLAFFLLRRRHGNFGGALSYGIGHGGIEAVLFCTFGMVNNIVASAVINTSGADAFALLFQVPVAEASVLAGAAPAYFLLGGAERVIAICFHIAASVLVWMAVTGRGPWGLYFLAILFHAMINFPVALGGAGYIANPWVLEGVFAAIVLVICLVTAQIYERCSLLYSPLLQYSPSHFGEKK